jgi:predicted nuclease with RNAse H fold
LFYCGIRPGHDFVQLVALEEVRVEEPPVRLHATFFEPGTAEAVAAQVLALGETVVAIATPLGGPAHEQPVRVCDAELQRRGVTPHGLVPAGPELRERLSARAVYAPGADAAGAREGAVAEGAYQEAGVFETNVEAVFCALQGRRVPARRHPLGVLRRIEELMSDMVVDPGGDLWHRRIEEIEAAAAALCAHRYAVGHACWVGDPEEGVIVLPGSALPERFSAEGVVPPVPRAPLAGGGSPPGG